MTITRLQTRARIRSDFLSQSPAEHRTYIDELARLHEGDYYERDKSDTVNAAYTCFVLVGVVLFVGLILSLVQWVSE
jgi:hypothetical protein